MFGKPGLTLNRLNKEYIELEEFLSQSPLRKVLVLGSGMLIEPLIDYLLEDNQNIILMASNEPLKLEELYNKRCLSNKSNHSKSKDPSCMNCQRLYIFEIEINIEENIVESQIEEDHNKIFYSHIEPSINAFMPIEPDLFVGKDDPSNNEMSEIKNKREKQIQLMVKENKQDLLEYLISISTVVIPFIPSAFHYKIAKTCIMYKKDMITSNLISESLKTLEAEFRKNKIVLIPELGLQPGLDHILCTKVINDMKKENMEIKGVETWCGLLPSPECLNNPLMHKFSFSPKQNIWSVIADTRQLLNGKVVRINKQSKRMSNFVLKKRFHPSLNLEGIYTEDSIEFKEKHNLHTCDTVIQGVLRYQGYSLVLQCFQLLGLLSSETIIRSSNYKTWRNYFQLEVLRKSGTINENTQEDFLFSKMESYEHKSIESENIANKSDLRKSLDKFYKKIVKGKSLKMGLLKGNLGESKFYIDITLATILKFDKVYLQDNSVKDLFNKLLPVFVFLDLFNEEIDFGNFQNKNSEIGYKNEGVGNNNSSVGKDNNNSNKRETKENPSVRDSNDYIKEDSRSNEDQSDNLFDCFLRLLEKKMKMENEDSDIVFLQNIFTLKNKEGQTFVKKYELMKFGHHITNKYSASSTLVALPTAIVTQMLLNQEIKEKGIVLPKSEEIIEKIFTELEKRNIFVTKRDEVVAKF